MMTRARIKKVSKLLSWLQKLRVRKATYWIDPKTKEKHIDDSVQSRFTLSFVPKRISGHTILPMSAKHESSVALSLMKGLGLRGEPIFQASYRVVEPKDSLIQGLHSVRVKKKISDSSVMEKFPNGRTNGPVCYVLALQGKKNSKAEIQGFQKKTKLYPASILLEELIEHSKSNNLRGIALLLPKHNILVPRFKVGYVSKMYYATATKLGFKKIKGSPYLWLIFDK